MTLWGLKRKNGQILQSLDVWFGGSIESIFYNPGTKRVALFHKHSQAKKAAKQRHQGETPVRIKLVEA